MKKQTFLFVTAVVLLCFTICSCQKKQPGVLTGITRFFDTTIVYDAEIGIVSDMVYSLPGKTSNGAVTITGNFHKGASVGILTVAGLAIDSVNDSTHQKGFDSSVFRKVYGSRPEITTGAEVGIPHLDIADFYSPEPLNAAFSGLLSINNVSLSSGFSVSWTPDPGSTSVYLTLYDPDVDPLVSITKTIPESAGAATFSPTDLSKFSSSAHLRLEMARGNDKVYPIGGKMIYVASVAILGISRFNVVP